MNNITIKEEKNVLACRVGNTIYINPKLKENKKLYDAAIKHELEHTEQFSIKDFLMDLYNEDLKGVKKDYYKFLLQNPRSILGLLPITRIGGRWVFDITMTIFTLIAGIIAYLSIQILL